MIEAIPTIFSFLAGVCASGVAGYFVWKRQTSQLARSSSIISGRVSDLEAQLARRAEEFANQMSAKTREHSEELDRLARERRHLDAEHLEELKTEVREAQEKGFADGKRQAELRADQNAKAFSVMVRPYILIEKDDGFFKKKKKLAIGYQYQLQVNGIPCFAPHIIIEQRYAEKIINQEVIERMTRLAIELAKVAVNVEAGPAGAFIPILEKPVIADIASKKVHAPVG